MGSPLRCPLCRQGARAAQSEESPSWPSPCPQPEWLCVCLVFVMTSVQIHVVKIVSMGQLVYHEGTSVKV